MKKWAGIGSRQTPQSVLEQMTLIGEHLAKNGWLLRSGHAGGADLAFENGCDKVNGQKEIFIPWRGFNGSASQFFNAPQEAFDLAAKLHPAWHNCSVGAKKLHARNCLQILGNQLNDPINLVVCWTPNGKEIGGTATALRLAKQYGIKIVNLAVDNFDFAAYNEGSGNS